MTIALAGCLLYLCGITTGIGLATLKAKGSTTHTVLHICPRCLARQDDPLEEGSKK